MVNSLFETAGEFKTNIDIESTAYSVINAILTNMLCGMVHFTSVYKVHLILNINEIKIHI